MGRVTMMSNLIVAGLAALALAAAVATLISAIVSEDDPLIRKNCLRECHEGEHYTCHYEFEVSRFQTYSWHCKDCGNVSCPAGGRCIHADGITRLVTVVNGQLPGPKIEVCEGDTVQVEVKNSLMASGVSLHWHGLLMRDKNGARRTPHMDGEPGVTQCPIMPGNTFTYRFVAHPAGSHFWHAQTGFQRGDGVFGAFIVRSPRSHNPNEELYDMDLSEHVIAINDWTHILGEEKFYLHHLSGFTNYPKSLLVNGQGPSEGDSIVPIPNPVKHQRFQVVKGFKYRFRLINTGFLNCPVSFSIEAHDLTVIAADGSLITPVNVTSLVIYSGERWDFVLNANLDLSSYWMSFVGLNDCQHDSVHQAALLDYMRGTQSSFVQDEIENSLKYLSPKPKYNKSKQKGKQLNNLRGFCNFDNLCLNNLNSSEVMPELLRKESADITLYFHFSKEVLNDTSKFSAPLQYRLPTPTINGYIFNHPPTPIIFQMKNPLGFCSSSKTKSEEDFKCLHVVKVSLRSVVDLILMEDGESVTGTVLHLHGNRFYILHQTWGRSDRTKNLTMADLKELNSKKKIKRNLLNPIVKDTVPLPRRGFIVIRFSADNPGFWMLESQLLFDAQSGMKVVLQVGESHEIPKPPMNFPLCGDFF